MGINIGNAPVGRVFFAGSPVREIYEGSRKIMGFNNVTPNTNLFTWSGGCSATNGSGYCGFSIPKLENIGANAQALDYCDDITFNTFEGGITLIDSTSGGETLSVTYVSESQVIGADKVYIVVRLNGNQVVKYKGGGYTNTRIRTWYDISSKTLKVQLDSTLIYTSSQLEWRPWKLNIDLGFYYYPPQVIPGNPPILIDGMFVGGWVHVYSINRAVGYPRT